MRERVTKTVQETFQHVSELYGNTSLCIVVTPNSMRKNTCTLSMGVVHRMHAQPCLTLCDPMDYSPPGSSVRRIFHKRTLEWIAISFARRSSPPGAESVSLASPALAGGFFTTRAT